MSVRTSLLFVVAAALAGVAAGACSIDERAFPGHSGGGTACLGPDDCQDQDPECNSASDCIRLSGPCVTVTCIHQRCQRDELDNVALSADMQKPGDCQQLVCQKGESTPIFDQNDTPDPANDGENCTKVVCLGMNQMEPPSNDMNGIACAGNGICQAGHCQQPDGAICGGNEDCVSHLCAESTCCHEACSACTSCALDGTGACRSKPQFSADVRCAISGQVCDGAGHCKWDFNHPCTTGLQCASGCCRQLPSSSEWVCVGSNNCP